MGMIDRYRKKGGFLQLVNLIETTGGDKREKFLRMIQDENAAWESEIRKKMLTFDRIASWSKTYLMEIFPHIPTQPVACALFALSPEKQALILDSLSYGDRRKTEEAIKEMKPNPGEIWASQVRIINEIRQLVSNGKIKFEKFDQDLAIPENIEELLASGTYIPSVALETYSEPEPSAAAPIAGANQVSSNVSDELALLRRKLTALTQDNIRLQKENKELREKVESIKDQIRKIAA